MNCEIISIGNELNEGITLNSNALFIAQKFFQQGWLVVRQTTVGDDLNTIQDAIQCAIGASSASSQKNDIDVVITTGGLGATNDDITTLAVANALGENLIVDKPLLKSLTKKIQDIFTAEEKRKSSSLNQSFLEQCKKPASFKGKLNPYGSAPFWYRTTNKPFIFMLPGVPYECENLFLKFCLPILKKKFTNSSHHLFFQTVGISELQLQNRLKDIPRTIRIAFLPKIYSVLLHLTSTDEALLQKEKKNILKKIDDCFLDNKQTTLDENLHHLLIKKKYYLGIVESCTGGLIAHRLVSHAASSRYLKFAVVAYHSDAKQKFCGINKKELTKFGEVSAYTAKHMLSEVVDKFNLQVGIATTGIAGPTGGSIQKPVGTVYVATYHVGKYEVKRYLVKGSRQQIQERSCCIAFNQLRKNILGIQ